MPGATIAADELRVGLLLTLLALSGVVVSEVAKDATLRRALLVGGTHMGILSGLVATTSLPGFRYSEPFQGGEQFILLQAHGWMILGAAGCLSLILMGSIEDVGVGVAGVGFASAIIFGDGVLFASLYYFQPGRRRRRLQSDGAKFLGDQTSILRKLPALLLALVAFVLLCTCESIRLSSREFGPTLLLAGCFAMVLSAVYTHIMLGGQMPGWRVFQPFRGGTEFVVLQAEGWMLLATVLNFGLVAGREQTP
uniref:Uncharacterized protein n=1 Tax=Pinguiococcus pyrenoidosus TaxID=172671 RepID=A0A7R9UGI1_9STRA|mmetsp:Transcript_9810/g.36951  ORF Transcript_9810/g.36951 Transcript_9810/m.36951 type:complete len:252 (+) Transcript_9810:359-1114(+)